MNIKDSLMESTILALQGKLDLKESKPSIRRQKRRKDIKKENIDISVQDDGSTVVDTDDATVTVMDKQDASEIVSTDVCPEEVVEVPVEGDETIIPEQEIPEETVEEITTDEPTVDEMIEEGKDCQGCGDKEKKEEDITIEVKDDEVEITSDEEHEVEVKEPEETETTEDETLTDTDDTDVDVEVEDVPEETVEDEEDVVEESKKLKTEDIDARPNETALLDYLEDIGITEDKDVKNLVIDLLKYLDDDTIKRFIEIHEYPISDKTTEGKDCANCKEEKMEEVKYKKFSSKTFNEALTKFYKEKYKAVESFRTKKVCITNNTIKVEGRLLNADKIGRNVCLEMKKMQQGKAFTKYELINTKGLMKESKDTSKVRMVTFLNKDKILECKYIIKK